jgi:hypothetical protein
MKDILKKNWNYTLREEGESFRLSVLAGSVGLYELHIILSESELDLFKSNGEPFVDDLANKIRSNPSAFEDRLIK